MATAYLKDWTSLTDSEYGSPIQDRIQTEVREKVDMSFSTEDD
jgi:hypothetical protein